MCHCPFIIFFWELNIIVIMLPLLRIVIHAFITYTPGSFAGHPLTSN